MARQRASSSKPASGTCGISKKRDQSSERNKKHKESEARRRTGIFSALDRMRQLLPRVNHEDYEKNKTVVLNEFCEQAQLLIKERRRLIAELELMGEDVGDEYKDHVDYTRRPHIVTPVVQSNHQFSNDTTAPDHSNMPVGGLISQIGRTVEEPGQNTATDQVECTQDLQSDIDHQLSDDMTASDQSKMPSGGLISQVSRTMEDSGQNLATEEAECSQDPQPDNEEDVFDHFVNLPED
ncbi:hypothetical protein MMC28_004455 [Mycoblastus sanguinarius]|nr:hypothetical protein [Mycoblastus sanguinarius]